ncbi:MAG: AAA family ATPase [Bacteroidia bacterium]
MLRLPYGISNFETLVNLGAFYVDRTSYIEKIENLPELYLFFLRPRRFGKSLWISVLQYYYGLEHKDKFRSRSLVNTILERTLLPWLTAFLVLKFDFSGIDTDSKEKTYQGFFSKVKEGVQQFLDAYSQYFPNKTQEDILGKKASEIMIGSLFTYAQRKGIPKIFLVIDEYDHFTNELISFRLDEFQEIVGANGYVRSFYERIKTATHDGVVNRFFATGVSPITLDSLTSGFNIGSNISRSPIFNEMMGFTESEVEEILMRLEIKDEELKSMMDEIRSWYNGYLFDTEGKRRMYNSDMVLYFAKEYQSRGKYPKSLLDTNVSSDYGKIGKLFRLGGEEAKRWELLQELLSGKDIYAQLTEQFSFARKFTESDFLSLLFYMGLLTIKEPYRSGLHLQIPNDVIRQLYFQYFAELLERRLEFQSEMGKVETAVESLAWENNPRPLVSLLEKTLGQLSNRDWQGFDEKHLKTILVSYLYSIGIYHIKSEPEMEQKYPDLLLRRRPPFQPPYQLMIELKFLHKKNKDRAELVAKEGRDQLRKYLQIEEAQKLDNLRGWLWVFVGTKAVVVEEISDFS